MFNNWWRILMGFIWKWSLKNYSLSLLEDFAARESEDTRCVLNPTNGRLKIMIIDLFRCPTVSNGNEYPCSITNTEAMPFLNEVTCFCKNVSLQEPVVISCDHDMIYYLLDSYPLGWKYTNSPTSRWERVLPMILFQTESGATRAIASDVFLGCIAIWNEILSS